MVLNGQLQPDVCLVLLYTDSNQTASLLQHSEHGRVNFGVLAGLVLFEQCYHKNRRSYPWWPPRDLRCWVRQHVRWGRHLSFHSPRGF